MAKCGDGVSISSPHDRRRTLGVRSTDEKGSLTVAGNLGGGFVTRDQEERNRVLGFPLERHPNTRPAGGPQHPRAERGQRQQGGEPQRVLGLPVDWFDEFANDVLRPLLRRIRGTRDHG